MPISYVLIWLMYPPSYAPLSGSSYQDRQSFLLLFAPKNSCYQYKKWEAYLILSKFDVEIYLTCWFLVFI